MTATARNAVFAVEGRVTNPYRAGSRWVLPPRWVRIPAADEPPIPVFRYPTGPIVGELGDLARVEVGAAESVIVGRFRWSHPSAELPGASPMFLGFDLAVANYAIIQDLPPPLAAVGGVLCAAYLQMPPLAQAIEITAYSEPERVFLGPDVYAQGRSSVTDLRVRNFWTTQFGDEGGPLLQASHTIDAVEGRSLRAAELEVLEQARGF